jgi:phospho-N-acetylmuramoyl-pentapeptide-transferase
VELKAILFMMGTSFLLGIILSPLFIPILRRLKFGQQIREEGPESHQKKSGTPTMGGTIILLSMLLSVLFVSRWSGEIDYKLYVLLIATLGYGLVGFLDDYIKIVFKRSLGLTAKQKLLGQLIVSVVVCVILALNGHSTDIAIPLTDVSLPLGWLYYPLIVLFMMGMSNAVNFTDGLDGLLSGTSAIAFGAFTVLAMLYSQPEVALFSAAMIGAVLAFLVFNAHPAKVFMGDTGSLAIGGGITLVAVLLKEEVLLLIIGGVFVIEILSVIIQVISFKTTGRRVFRMSPIHHHFELAGWSEWKVVIVFWLAGLVLAGLGLLISKGL